MHDAGSVQGSAGVAHQRAVLRLPFERHVRSLEERQKRAVVETVESVQHRRLAAALRLADLEAARERQTEKVLIEPPCFRGIATAVSAMVQSLDHCASLVFD